MNGLIWPVSNRRKAYGRKREGFNMQDVKQLGYVGQLMPTAKPRAIGKRKRHPKDAREDEQHSQQYRSKQDPDDEHVVDEYA